MRVAFARRVIEDFLSAPRQPNYSSSGLTNIILVLYCVAQRIPFTCRYNVKHGTYVLKRLRR